jgi:DNA-directed RNA polymerase sigma subunit (sigma70/sigma32)
MTGNELNEYPEEEKAFLFEGLAFQNQDESLEDLVINKTLREELKTEFSKFLDTLHPRDSAIIRSRLGIGGTRQKSRHEVSDEFGLTIERIMQIESRTMSKLRHPLRSKALREFLEEL